ncbi:MAG: hypothetical protein WB723_14885 [Candidatus Acidiferrales bacterium]
MEVGLWAAALNLVVRRFADAIAPEWCNLQPLDSFLDISAERIIGGEIVVERFRFVADGAACEGHSEDSKIE